MGMLRSPGCAALHVFLAHAEPPQGCLRRWFLLSPVPKPLCSIQEEGSNELYHISAAHARSGDDTSPSLPHGRVHPCSQFAHVTQPSSPNHSGQTWSTQTAPYPRQSDRTPIGLNLGGAQDTADGSPSFWCLPLKNSGQLGPSFCTTQQGHSWLDLNTKIPPQSG